MGIKTKIAEELAKRVQGGDSLAMDFATRMARAKEMGFDVDQTVYHGTDEEFIAFDMSNFGETYGTQGEPAIYTTTSRDHAAIFGDEVKELTLKGNHKQIDANKWLKETYDSFDSYQKKEVYDVESGEYISEEVSFDDWVDSLDGDDIYRVLNLDDMLGNEAAFAKKEGFEGVTVDFKDLSDRIGNVNLTFDPKNIRSTQAAFDPAKKESSNLLAGQAGIAGAVGLGAAGSSQEAEAGIIRPEKRNPALKALSILEPAAMIGSSMARESLAGLGGLAAGLDPYAPEGEGGRFTEYLQRTLPVYEPRTKEGIQGLEALGGGITDIAKYFNDSRLAEPLRAAKENFNESNEWVFDNYGPGAATVLRVLPDIVF
jgi:hypothetical protein